jgi:hypothetical protein
MAASSCAKTVPASCRAIARRGTVIFIFGSEERGGGGREESIGMIFKVKN